MSKWFDTWLADNSTAGRLSRTIAQGIISVLLVNIDTLLGLVIIPPELKPVLVAVITAILSPVMSELRKRNEVEHDQ